MRREARARACNPADRFSFGRLIEGFPAPPAPPKPRATWQEAVAVYTVIGWGPENGDIMARADWAPELLQNRYIRLWIFRHRHLPAETLIATLAAAIDAADTGERGLVLPELSGPAAVCAPPLTPARRSTMLSDAQPRGTRRRRIGRASPEPPDG